MAIATIKPDVDYQPRPSVPVIQDKNFKGTVYDNNNVPLTSLIAYAEGAPWTVTYYKQVLGDHNDLKPLDTSLDPTFQSYERIDQLELRVNQELDSRTDSVQQITQTTGSALIYGFMVPNTNDYFVTEVAYQRKALFRVVDVDRKTFRRESVHVVSYQMVNLIDDIPIDYQNLQTKTIRVYVFSRERLIEGLDPYLKTEDYELLTDLRQDYYTLANYYLDTFYDLGTKTLILPGQTAIRIYDPFVVRFILKTLSFNDFDQMLGIKDLPTNNDVYIEQPQFWQAVINQDYKLLAWCNQVMHITSTREFNANSWVKGMFFARMDEVVYPYRPDVSVNSGEPERVKCTFKSKLQPTTNRHGFILSDQQKTFKLLDKDILSYPMVGQDEYYVLSKALYENIEQELTLLEIVTRDYLNKATINRRYLKHLVELFPKMERMEQFYYGPLLLTLLRYADKRIY